MNAPNHPLIRFPFDNAYARLPERFYARLNPTPVKDPALIRFNHALADQLGLATGQMDDAALAAVFAGNHIPEGAEPLAMAYAGHQFGNFVPQLGDGRANLIGELRDAKGLRFDIHLKGSGRTPFSRGGDGRAAIGPVVREYLVSEAMHALGIPTTRSLAAVSTGEQVMRERLLPGAILTRVARSHVRVGSFEFFAAQGDQDAVKTLADFVIDRLYPDCREAANPYLALLEQVAKAQAKLIAQWMGVGFIHGVMNTDNMAISGETIDYGPCAFMDHYREDQVFSSIDQYGRYAYNNQGPIGQWNLARFAETLLRLIDDDVETAVKNAEPAVFGFQDDFQQQWLTTMARKLGLAEPRTEDAELINDLLDLMQASEADYTLGFRYLADTLDGNGIPDRLAVMFTGSEAFRTWLRRWQQRLGGADAATVAEQMRQTNPIYIPRNHRIEQAIAAAEAGDFGLMHELHEVLRDPFTEKDAYRGYEDPPLPSERIYQTFCGT